MKIDQEKNPNKGVQLITYADTMGKDLGEMKIALDKYLQDAIQGVHILPFYPSSADRGFAPLTHRKIDPKFGAVEDFQDISHDYDLMADLIVNHVSKDSKYFQDYLKNGDNSKYRNFFIKAKYFSRRGYKEPKSFLAKSIFFALGQIITAFRNLDFILHKHGVNRLILKKIYRPRPDSPFVKYVRQDGKSRYIWCTFSPDQVDLNIKSPAVKRKFRRDIRFLENLGIKYLRLDAVAYAGKRRGTNSFLIPETLNFITWLGKHAHKHNMAVVPEVHYHYKAQISLANLKNVDYVYDFATPFLMLHGILYGDAQYLKNWFRLRPHNSISNLDTHDGIGVIDVEGLLPPEEMDKTCKKIYQNGGNASMRASGTSSNNVDVYQINSTYYSALNEDDDSYLLARAIQLFLPGIPQIYYVGMLAGKNDEILLMKTRNGRDINRHYYKLEEIAQETQRQVVKDLKNLCQLRNTHPAFKGSFSLKESDDETIIMNWQYTKYSLTLEADLKAKKFSIIDQNQSPLHSVNN